MKFLAIALFTLFSSVSAHGVVVSPEPRRFGDALKKACGVGVYLLQAVNKYGPVEVSEQIFDLTPPEDPSQCQLYLCSGLKYDDSRRARRYHGGEVVHIQVEAPVKHLEGHANVSVVDTTKNTIIGETLAYWPDYQNALELYSPANQTNFYVTLPDSFGGACKKEGVCVIQWYWYSKGELQTFASCIDFVSKD